jgi:hypothetical protein
VLFVVHNGTTLDRLLDVAAVFADDLRVRIVVTSDLSDPFAESLPEQVATVGLAAVPWATAKTERYDLIVAAGYHGPFDELRGPLLALVHGAGFGKYTPERTHRSSRRELATTGHVVGDHGSVTVYGAALGKPTLLAAFPDHEVVARSPAHRPGEVADRYDPDVPIDVPLDKAVGRPELAASVTAVPGEARARLRATRYRLLDLEGSQC